jgi:hypothetical protein
MDGRIWTRRTFVSALGAAAVVAPRWAEAAAAGGTVGGRYRAFVGASDGSLAAYRVDGGRWASLGGAVAVERPLGLALHPTLPVLYATDAVDGHGDRPRGSVAAFRVTADGLEAINVEGTALSSTGPSHLSVVDDMLLVSAAGGGAYNAFALGGDGAILPVQASLKQIGGGPHALQERAAPHASVAGELGAYSSDLGADRVNHLVFADGLVRVASRVSLPAGSGPGDLALAGSWLVVASRLRPGLTVLPVDGSTGALETAVHAVDLEMAEAGPLVVSGGRVYVAGVDRGGETVVAAFGLARTGRPRALQVVTAEGAGRPEQMVAADGELLLAGSGGVTRVPVVGGRMGAASLVLKKAGVVSLVVA